MSGSEHGYAGTTAIVGIGATEFSKESGRSDLRLAVEAVDLALRDAGIQPAEVDGMVTFSADTNPEIEIARSLGVGELSFFSRIHYGGGAACATIQQAAMAVQTGVADVVVCYRAFNERSGHRFGTGVQDRAPVANAETAHFAWYAPVGLFDPGPVGGHGRPALPAHGRRHLRGPGPGGGGRPASRRRQPQGLVLREADHPRGPSGVAVDRRAAPSPRLLPGDRWRAGPGGHLPRAGPGPPDRAGRHRGGRSGIGTRTGDDDLLLRGRSLRAGRDGGRGPPAVADLGSHSGRHPDGCPLRPLHPLCPLSARGIGLLRPGGGQGLRRATATSRSAAAYPSTPTGASWARPTCTA